MRKKIFIFTVFALTIFINSSLVIAETYDNYKPNLTSCGNGMIDSIPTSIPKIISIIYRLIHIAVPVVLVIMGTLDLFKGLSAQKEDDIKKGQQMFIKRLISAAVIFFVFAIVKFVISFVADGNGNDIMDCAECFINNECGYISMSTKQIISSIKNILNSNGEESTDPDLYRPEHVSWFRDQLILIVGEDYENDDKLIKEIERRLKKGDYELSKELTELLS